MDIHVRIDAGRIVVEQPRGHEVARHDAEGRAAAHIAYQVVNKARRVSYDASCRAPERHGLPGFSLPAFEARLGDEVAALRRSMLALAA